jgi:hypothetical protein
MESSRAYLRIVCSESRTINASIAGEIGSAKTSFRTFASALLRKNTILVKRDGHLILLQTNNANEYLFNRFIREGKIPQRSEVHTHSDRNLGRAIDDCSKFVAEWQQNGNVSALMSPMALNLPLLARATICSVDGTVSCPNGPKKSET